MTLNNLKSKLVQEMNLLIRVKGNDLLVSNCRPKSWNKLITTITDEGYTVTHWRAYRDIDGNIIDQLTLN